MDIEFVLVPVRKTEKLRLENCTGDSDRPTFGTDRLVQVVGRIYKHTSRDKGPYQFAHIRCRPINPYSLYPIIHSHTLKPLTLGKPYPVV